MSFSKLGFTPIGGTSKYGAAPQRFAYRTADSLATVAAAGYFAEVRTMLAIGDTIDVVVVDDATTPTHVLATGSLLVTSVTSTTAYTADITTGAYAGGLIRMPFYFNETDLLAGTSQYILSPVAGSLRRLVTCVKKQVTTGGAIAVELSDVAVTGLSITVADSAAVGTVQTDAPTSDTRLTANQAIEITAAAAFATAGEVRGYVEIAPDVDTGDIYVPFFANATDLSAGTSQRMPCPVAGQIVGAAAVVQVAIVTGGAITFELADVAVVGLTLTVADAAAVGTVYSDTPTDLAGATGAVANEQALETVLATAFNGGGAVNGYITVRPTVKTKSAFHYFFVNQTDLLAGTSHYMAAQHRGVVKRAATAVQVGVTTGGNVTFEIANVAVAGLTVVVGNTSSAADVDRDDALAGDITGNINADTALEVVLDSAFDTAGALNGFVEIAPA
jgi:hypothetical protein